MKKLIALCLLTCFASSSFAENSAEAQQPKIDAYTQLCLAALKSDREFISTARKLGVTKNERDRLVCNDLSVDEFASNYELVGENTIATVQ